MYPGRKVDFEIIYFLCHREQSVLTIKLSTLDPLPVWKTTARRMFASGLNSKISKASKIVGPFQVPLRCSGEPSLIHVSGHLKKSFIVHFKQLRSLELSFAVSLTDFSLWEVLDKLT